MADRDAASCSRKLAFHFFTFILSIILIIGILEIIFRAANIFLPPIYKQSPIPGLGFELRPGAFFRAGHCEGRLNNYGFHDSDFSVDKKDNVLRVVCLGDSLTQAFKMREKLNFTGLLEQRMRNSYPEHEVEFYNMAVGGYNTMQEWLTYDSKSKKFSPDLVLVQFTLNDLTYSYPFGLSDSFSGGVKYFLYQHFRTYGFLKYLKLKLKGGFDVSQHDFKKMDPHSAPVGVEFMQPIFNPQSEYFKKWETAISHFGKLNRAGTRVLFVIFPWPVYNGMSRGEPYPYYVFHDHVKEVLKKEGIPCVDITPNLTAEGMLQQFWIEPDDFHFNAKAHEIIADALEPEIKKHLRIKSTATIRASGNSFR